MGGRQRRLAAIFFSDMKGFSSQMDADEEGTLDRLDRHNAVMRSQIEGHGGRVIKTVGDAFMAEFTSSVAAVKCALDCLRDFDTQNAEFSDEEAIRIRIGVHVGDVVVEGDDLFGEAVNVAARLEPQAPVGGVCISEAVYAQVRRKVHARGEVRSAVSLKGIGEAMRLYALWPSTEHLDVSGVPPPAPSPSRRPWLVVVVACLVLAGLAVVVWPRVQEVDRASVAPTLEAPLSVPSSGVRTRSQDAADPRRGGTLRVGWQGDWGTFSPAQATSNVSGAALDVLLEPLVRVSAAGKLQPWVLEQAVVDEAGALLTLQLRAKVAFHPHPCLTDGVGRAATAEDVVASIEHQHRFLDPAPILGISDFREGKTAHIDGVRVTSSGEVQITLTHPAPYPLHLFSHVLLLPEEFTRGCDLPPPGTGPFVATEPLDGGTLTMRRAPGYWGEPALLDAVELSAVGDDEVGALARMGRGELDLLGLTRSHVVADPRAEMPELAPRFSKLDVSVAPWVNSQETVTASIMWVVRSVNFAKPGPGVGLKATSWSPRARRALGYALDRRALLAVYPGLMNPATRFIDTRLMGSNPATVGFDYDQEWARSLLVEAGHPGGEGLEPLRLGVKPDRREVGALIVSQAAAVGLPIAPIAINNEGLGRAFQEGSLDAALVEVNDTVIGNDPYSMFGSLLFLYSDNKSPVGDRVRALVYEMTRETDRTRRSKLYGDVEVALLESPPHVPIGFSTINSPSTIVVSRHSVQGVADPVTGRVNATNALELCSQVWLRRDP